LGGRHAVPSGDRAVQVGEDEVSGLVLGDRDTAGLSTRYGIEVKDQICTGDEPAPDPSRMIDR
jgi:hypothetical protein